MGRVPCKWWGPGSAICILYSSPMFIYTACSVTQTAGDHIYRAWYTACKQGTLSVSNPQPSHIRHTYEFCLRYTQLYIDLNIVYRCVTRFCQNNIGRLRQKRKRYRIPRKKSLDTNDFHS